MIENLKNSYDHKNINNLDDQNNLKNLQLFPQLNSISFY